MRSKLVSRDLLDPEAAVGLAARELDGIGLEEVAGGIGDGCHDTRPVEVRRQTAADLEDALDGVEALPPLVVEAGRSESRGDRPGEHLGDRDMGRSDRLGRGALEVDDARGARRSWSTGTATSLRTSGRAAR